MMEPRKTPRNARTPACRVHTRVNAWDSVAVGIGVFNGVGAFKGIPCSA
jgi:hypothetical protein